MLYIFYTAWILLSLLKDEIVFGRIVGTAVRTYRHFKQIEINLILLCFFKSCLSFLLSKLLFAERMGNEGERERKRQMVPHIQ